MTVYEKSTGDRYGWLYRKAKLFVPNISDLVGHPYMCAISKYGEDGKNGT